MNKYCKRLRTRALVWAAMLAVPLSAQSAGWSSSTKVAYVYPYSDGSVYVSFVSNYNPDGCGSSTLLNVSTSNTGLKNIYAALLAAKMGDRNVQYYVSGCLASQYPLIVHVQVY